MRNIRSFLLFGAIVVGIVIVFVANANSSAAQIAVPQSAFSPTPSIVHGAAIALRISNDPTLTVPGARFTSADAALYVSSHGVPHALTAVRPVVDTVAFITSQAASTRLKGESIGLPDSSLVCYVTFHGSFSVPGPPNSKQVTFSKAAEIFDAQTGSLLLVSFLS